MRRPLLCLAAAMLMAWVGFRLSADEPRALQAPVQQAANVETAMKPPVIRKSKKRERYGQVAAKALPYPVFGIDEVLDHLTKVGAKLHQAGQTKGDVELRKQLSRKTCELTLPAATEAPLPDRELYARACDSVFIVCSLYKSASRGDWQTSLAEARKIIPANSALQGNLSPTLIAEATPEVVAAETKNILEAMRGRPGHIFNLGHGLTPAAKLENIAALAETVKGFK